MRLAIVLVLVLLACNAPPKPPKPGSADDLAAYLRGVAGADEATRAREVATWVVPEATWNRTIVPPWRSLYGEYVAGFAAASAATVSSLASLDPVTTRRHYAGDPRLTLGEARLRWALPVQYPSMVADIGGRPLDAVFIYDGRWRALLGLDELVVARVRALDADCAAKVAIAGPLGHCSEIGFVVAAAALRGGGEDLARACRMAAMMCGNPAP
jgi:hypothetical protein